MLCYLIRLEDVWVQARGIHLEGAEPYKVTGRQELTEKCFATFGTTTNLKITEKAKNRAWCRTIPRRNNPAKEGTHHKHNINP